jgi:type 1 fimbria pilin
MSTLMRSLLLLTSVLLGGVVPARAQNVGTANVTLNGSIGPGTCTVAAVSKVMPTLGANVFNPSPTWAGGVSESHTPVDLTLSACSGVTGATFVFGTAADADATNAEFYRNKAANPAPNTAIRLRDTNACSTGNSVRPGASVSRAFSGASFSLPLCALYYKLPSGVVSRGGLSTTFTVTVTYR